jgi:hypothetical protein
MAHKKTIAGIELTITNTQERLSMGGPHTGDVQIDDGLVLADCVLDNFVFREDQGLLFFVKYHSLNNYQYFTINFTDLTSKAVFEFEREFDMIHIKGFLGANELEYYNAFHANFNYAGPIFDLNKEEFRQV